MIFVWIGNIVSFIKYLFVPPETIIPKRSDRAPCPVCGHKRNRLTAATNNSKPSLQHDCLICKATWFEAPVLSAPALIKAEDESTVLPAKYSQS